jgi:hypothetical protein
MLLWIFRRRDDLLCGMAQLTEANALKGARKARFVAWKSYVIHRRAMIATRRPLLSFACRTIVRVAARAQLPALRATLSLIAEARLRAKTLERLRTPLYIFCKLLGSVFQRRVGVVLNRLIRLPCAVSPSPTLSADVNGLRPSLDNLMLSIDEDYWEDRI